MTNKNYSNFKDGRSNYKLTISEQIDLLYLENNELKNHISQLENDKENIIKQCEDKLCKMEYDQNIMSQEMYNNKNIYENQIFHMNEEIRKYKHLINERNNENKSLLEDYKKLEERYRVANEYINVLPTPQETDRLNKNLRRLKVDNEKYRNQYTEAELVIRRLETELSEKNVELANSCDKEVVMKSQMDLLSEKLSNIKCSPFVKEEAVINDWNYSADVYADMKLAIERYKNELSNCKQLVDVEKMKYQKHIVACQLKLEDLHLHLDSETETIIALKKEIDNKQVSCNEMEKRLKACVQEKQNILGNMIDLENEIQRIDRLGSDNVQQLYHQLLRETLSCVRETDTIVHCIHKLINQQDMDLSMLINCSELENLTIEDDIPQLLDKGYLQNQLDCIKNSKLRISEIRSALLQRYTDNMAMDVKFCLMQ